MKTNELLNKIRSQVAVYKPIVGYENYMVSSMGNVMNVKTGRVLKIGTYTGGYLKVNLCSNGKQSTYPIHRLVAEAFIPNPENKSQVNHMDEVKSNNKLDNLEWMSSRENCNYGTRNERMSMALKGRKLSDETKKRMSESHKSQTPWNKGKKLQPLSEERKRKLSEIYKGKHRVLGSDGKRHWR